MLQELEFMLNWEPGKQDMAPHCLDDFQTGCELLHIEITLRHGQKYQHVDWTKKHMGFYGSPRLRITILLWSVEVVNSPFWVDNMIFGVSSVVVWCKNIHNLTPWKTRQATGTFACVLGDPWEQFSPQGQPTCQFFGLDILQDIASQWTFLDRISRCFFLNNIPSGKVT